MKTVHRIVLSDDYIAQAQRLTIAQDKRLRLMYQTWWVWWLPRVVLLATIGFLLAEKLTLDATLPAVFLLLSFFGEFSARRTLAAARERSSVRGSTTTVAMTENGIDTIAYHGNTHLNWESVLPPRIRPDGVIVQLSRLSSMWLPDIALVEGSPAQVRQLLAENVKA